MRNSPQEGVNLQISTTITTTEISKDVVLSQHLGVAAQDEPGVQSVVAALIIAAANQKGQHVPASLGAFPDIHSSTQALPVRVLRLRARLVNALKPPAICLH